MPNWHLFGISIIFFPSNFEDKEFRLTNICVKSFILCLYKSFFCGRIGLMDNEKLTIKIRLMEVTDVDGVIEIERRAYGEHHWSRDSFISEIKNELARYYCAVDDENKIIGYAGTWQILEEVHITNIAVDPNLHRMHIGEALLTRIIEDCYKNLVKYITLEVRVSNIAAINLYEKYGFKSFGVRKGYYQNNNEDALIMWTENIFYDKFKSGYEKTFEQLKGKINVL